MKLQGQQHCHLVAKAVEKLQTSRQTRASRSYAKKKRQSKNSRGCPLSPAARGDLAISCFSLIPCQHRHCFSQHQAERSMGCYKAHHLCLGLSGNVLLQLQVQPQSFWWKEKQDCAITRILHPPSFSSAKSSPLGSAVPTCKS